MARVSAVTLDLFTGRLGKGAWGVGIGCKENTGCKFCHCLGEEPTRKGVATGDERAFKSRAGSSTDC